MTTKGKRITLPAPGPRPELSTGALTLIANVFTSERFALTTPMSDFAGVAQLVAEVQRWTAAELAGRPPADPKR